MKKFHKILCAVLALAMTASIGLGLTACKRNEEGGNPTIQVMAKGQTHAFWKSVERGAKAAGEKYGYSIVFRGPKDETPNSIPEQKRLVSAAVSDSNTKALVIATIGQGFGDYLKRAKEKNMPVVEFDSGIFDKSEIPDPSPVVSSVATSNRLAAKLAAEKFYETVVKAELEKGAEYKVGIIQHDKSQTGIDRAGGFEEALIAAATEDKLNSNLKIEKEIKDNTSGAYKSGLDALQTKGCKAIFMSNEGVVKECYAAVTSNPNQYKDLLFCGFDAGTSQINWSKDNGAKYAKLVGSVAQDSYNIGYKAVEQAAFALDPEKTVESTVGIDGVWWNNSNVDQMIQDGFVYEG